MDENDEDEDFEPTVVLTICEYVHTSSTIIPKGMVQVGCWKLQGTVSSGYYIPIDTKLSFYERTSCEKFHFSLVCKIFVTKSM